MASNGARQKQIDEAKRQKQIDEAKQKQIDDLINDSYGDSSIVRQSQNIRNSVAEIKESDEYENDGFESYDQSRNTIGKSHSKTQFEQSKRFQAKKAKLPEIKQQVLPKEVNSNKAKIPEKRPKSGIYFQAKKPHNTSNSKQKQNLPYNYARLADRQKQLLLTSLTQQNKQLKEVMRTKENEFKKLQNAYKVLLQDKAQNSTSVKQTMLEKQLSTLQQKYHKLQQLCRIQQTKTSFKSSKSKDTFIPQEKANQREEELLDIIQSFKNRLVSTTNELKTVQKKLQEGQNYVDELRRKLRRIEQLELKIQKLTEQAQNDRTFIEFLKDKNKKLQDEKSNQQRQMRLLKLELDRMRLGGQTQKDCFSQLQQIRKQKESLEKNLRQLTNNLMSKVRTNPKQFPKIQDSGQIFKT